MRIATIAANNPAAGSDIQNDQARFDHQNGGNISPNQRESTLANIDPADVKGQPDPSASDCQQGDRRKRKVKVPTPCCANDQRNADEEHEQENPNTEKLF